MLYRGFNGWRRRRRVGTFGRFHLQRTNSVAAGGRRENEELYLIWRSSHARSINGRKQDARSFSREPRSPCRTSLPSASQAVTLVIPPSSHHPDQQPCPLSFPSLRHFLPSPRLRNTAAAASSSVTDLYSLRPRGSLGSQCEWGGCVVPGSPPRE